MKHRKIAIVGCGIAGLASAIFLARAGHDVQLFDKFDKPKALGAGLLLQPTGLAVLSELGLAGKALRKGKRIHQLTGHVANGGVEIFNIDYRDLHPGLFGVGIHRATLFDLLFAEVRKLKVPITAKTEIISGKEQIDGKIILANAGNGEFGPFDIVVAADGANSKLRAAHAEIRHDKPYPYGALWGVVDALEFESDRLTQRYQAASKMMGILPLGNSGKGPAKAALFWSLPVKDFEHARAQGLELWQQEAIALWPEAEPLISQFQNFNQLTEARYSDTTLFGFSEGRMIFIGDACHVTSPQLGQGANMALLDASALAHGLASNETVLEALQQLEKNRKDQTKFYCLASRWITPFFQSNMGIAANIRDVTFPLMGKIKFTRTEMLRTLAGLKSGLFRHMPPEYFVYDEGKN